MRSIKALCLPLEGWAELKPLDGWRTSGQLGKPWMWPLKSKLVAVILEKLKADTSHDLPFLSNSAEQYTYVIVAAVASGLRSLSGYEQFQMKTCQ